MNSIAKKLKKLFISFACLFAFTNMMTFINAETVQATKTKNISTSLGTASTTLRATHYDSGNTRWAASGTATSNVYNTYVYFTMDTNSMTNTYMHATAHVTLTTAGNVSASGSKDYYCYYNTSTQKITIS